MPIDEHFLDLEEKLLREAGLLSVKSYVGATPDYIPRDQSEYAKAIEALNATGVYADEHWNAAKYTLFDGGIERVYRDEEGYYTDEAFKLTTNNPKAIDDFLRYEYALE